MTARSRPNDRSAVSGSDTPVELFEAERARLTGLAYRMLGSVADAEDVVSEAWVRFQRADPSTVERPAAWLTTVTSRLAIDRLRSQSSRREDYVGPWLPDPVVTSVPGAVGPVTFEDPAERAELSESLTLGFLVVLDRLGPVERAVFLLADVFGEPYAEISRAVGRSEEACRQIASRARRRVREERADRTAADEQLLAGLVGALAVGDVDGLLELLSPDVVLTSDGGPDRHAARRPVLGPHKVSRLLLNLAGRMPEGVAMEIQHVNAAPALVMHHPDGTMVLSADRSDDGHVAAIRIQLNPDKVAALDSPFPGV
jgi:RNA polymerase sigma-70 factor (ECF subfamily)